MELNRLLEIAAERAMCDLCPDSGDDACVACPKVKGVTADELREYHAAVKDAIRRTAEHDKAMEEGRLVELPCKVGDDVFFNIWNITNQKYETLPGTIKNVRYDAIDGCVMVSNGEYFRVLGRDAFLSRQEAEAALDGGGAGD